MPDLSELSENLAGISDPAVINKFFDEILTDKEKKDILFSSFSKEKILSTQEMAKKVLDCYCEVLRNVQERTGVA